jgi:cytoskeletal protein CcmA (bactofilin family)
MTADVSSTKTPAEERRTTAWIGQGVVIEGKISSAQDLRIDGTVEGTIEVGQHALIVGDSAIIRANLVAKTIVISGAVTGNVTATETIELQPSASVEGDVTARSLVMADGALIKGRVDVGANRAATTP